MAINKHIVAGLSVALLLSACSSKPKPGPDITPQQPTQQPATPPTDTTGTGQTDGTMTTAPTTSASTATPGSQADLVQSAGADRVFFGYDADTLDATAQDTLKRQAEWLAKYPNVRLQIEGHCDERGTREYNLALGDRRAEAVRSYLGTLGVSSDRLTTISYGKERPEMVGSDDESYAQNRRGVSMVRGN
jgi:peptidoglycan-associated lipoprotein